MKLLYETLLDLWHLLNQRERWVSVALVVMLIASGLFEMGGIFFLFGYIGALSDAESGNTIVQFYRVITRGLDGRNFAFVAGLVLILAFFLKNVSGLLTNFLLLRFLMKRFSRISTRLFSAYLDAPVEILLERGATSVIQKMHITSRVFGSCFSAALSAVSELSIITTILVALALFVDWVLVVIGAVLFGAAGYFFLTSTRRLSIRLGERKTAEQHEMTKIMQDSLRGIIDLKLGKRQSAMTKRYNEVAQRLSLFERRSSAIQTAPRALNEMLLTFGIVLAAVVFAGRPGGMEAALPVLAVVGFAGLRLAAAMSRLTMALQKLRQFTNERTIMMGELEEYVSDPKTQSPAVMLASSAIDRIEPAGLDRLDLRENILVQGVSFAYPESDIPAVRDISLEIPAGFFIGLCGPSGGGKSTLALILMGLVQPTKGVVQCDGKDIRDDIPGWHSNIGYVGQQPFIAPRTLRENVAFLREPDEIDNERVMTALEMAQLGNLVNSFPKGLDTDLGEDGARLSGGQRQRICIARALYDDPKLLFFDEATAALDNITESAVTKAIGNFSGSKTIVAIAHRLSTLKACDRIYVIKDGQIAASGDFSELESNDPYFQRLLRGDVDVSVT